jgi:hypothetical protein
MVQRLPYSPTLALSESWVKVYKIYVLKDPFTDEIFYVGQTYQEIATRLSGHINEPETVNPAKKERIRQILERGGKPKIEEIETIPGTCYADKLFVNDREIFWVKVYKSRGVKLLNIASSHSEAECKEFKVYRRSVEVGQHDYRYYYCGKTYGGHEVYDEKKMHIDGFVLSPGEQEPKIRVIEKITEKVVERVVERIVERVKTVEVIVEKPVYIERPSVITIYMGEAVEQPSWTPEFAASIPFNELIKFDYEEDESELEEDLSDYEPDIDEYDDCDDEPDPDDEPDCDDEDDEQPPIYY